MSGRAGQITTADGGGGAVSSVNAQTGAVVLGATDVGAEATDAELDALAALGSAANKAPYFTDSGVAALFDLSAFARTVLDDTSAASVRTTLGLVIGTDVAAQDAGISSLAGVDTGADLLPYTTGANAWTSAALTSFGRSLIDDANASSGRTTLGVAIGTDVQAFDAGLASLVGVDTAADLLPYTTAANTWASTSLTTFARTVLDDTTQAAARTTLGLAIGTDVQAQDAELAAIAGLTSAADKLPYFTGSGTAALADLSSFARTVLDDTTQANARTTLGVGTGDSPSLTNVTISGTPSASTHAARLVDVGDALELNFWLS